MQVHIPVFRGVYARSLFNNFLSLATLRREIDDLTLVVGRSTYESLKETFRDARIIVVTAQINTWCDANVKYVDGTSVRRWRFWNPDKVQVTEVLEGWPTENLAVVGGFSITRMFMDKTMPGCWKVRVLDYASISDNRNLGYDGTEIPAALLADLENGPKGYRFDSSDFSNTHRLSQWVRMY